jgi:hypothetical protein
MLIISLMIHSRYVLHILQLKPVTFVQLGFTQLTLDLYSLGFFYYLK